MDFFFLRVIATFNFTILTFFFVVYDSKFLRKILKCLLFMPETVFRTSVSVLVLYMFLVCIITAH